MKSKKKHGLKSGEFTLIAPYSQEETIARLRTLKPQKPTGGELPIHYDIRIGHDFKNGQPRPFYISAFVERRGYLLAFIRGQLTSIEEGKTHLTGKVQVPPDIWMSGFIITLLSAIMVILFLLDAGYTLMALLPGVFILVWLLGVRDAKRQQRYLLTQLQEELDATAIITPVDAARYFETES